MDNHLGQKIMHNLRNSSTISVVEIYLREIRHGTLEKLKNYLDKMDVRTLKVDDLLDFYELSM